MMDPHEAAEIFAARLADLPNITLGQNAVGEIIDKSTNRYGQKSAYLSAGATSATGRRFRWDIRISDHSAATDIAHISIVLPTIETIDEAVAFISKEIAR